MDKFSSNISPRTYNIKVFKSHQHEINLNLVNLAQDLTILQKSSFKHELNVLHPSQLLIADLHMI
jgi:hypothetical protein